MSIRPDVIPDTSCWLKKQTSSSSDLFSPDPLRFPSIRISGSRGAPPLFYLPLIVPLEAIAMGIGCESRIECA